MASLPPSKHSDLLVLLTISYATGSAGSASNKQTSEENKMLGLLRAEVLLSSPGWERFGQ